MHIEVVTKYKTWKVPVWLSWAFVVLWAYIGLHYLIHDGAYWARKAGWMPERPAVECCTDAH